MDRRTDEGAYVLKNLHRARQDVIAHPEWFEPDALERINKAMAAIEEALPNVEMADMNHGVPFDRIENAHELVTR
jgi:hypothetical protein